MTPAGFAAGHSSPARHPPLPPAGPSLAGPYTPGVSAPDDKPRAWPEDPKVCAMLLCDHAHRDPATGKFSLLGGIGVRIRRIQIGSLAPGAVIDGPTIFNADLGSEIDNLEGIDVHVTPEGETVLTLISDDNFSMIQRNLLLQFTLVD